MGFADYWRRLFRARVRILYWATVSYFCKAVLRLLALVRWVLIGSK